MDRLREAPADAVPSTSAGQQHPNDRKESSSKHASPGDDVKCCRRQHQVLVTYIRHALQNWGPSDELPLSYWIDGARSRWEPTAPMQLTPELKRVLTRAKSLSEECCRELAPLKAALRHAERSEAFADILRELHWCTSVVLHTMACRKLESDLAPLKDFPWQAQLGYHEHFLLEKAAEEDWQQLLGELEIWRRGHICSAEGCGNMHLQTSPSSCLAGQVLRGLTPEEGEGGQDHRSLLWSFDQDVLKYVGPLGSGSFAQVEEVTWLGFNYAEKIFNFTGLPTLAAEADASVKLNHPHIVKVLAYSEDSLLMDLMSMDLHNFIRRRMRGGTRVQPFSLPAGIDLMLQIAEAVSYVHSQGMAHRDLKSMNILVNPVSDGGADDGFVFAKITDFGLVKTKREITRYSHLTHDVGSRKWMAPEIFKANMEDDHLEEAFPMKADVYSFGIVCFEILSGEEPFRDVQVADLYSQLTAPFPLRPSLPSSCPTDLASLVCACWDADPRERPEFADVCRVLRYLKGVQLLTEVHESNCLPTDRVWPFGRLTPLVQEQGLYVAQTLHLSSTLERRQWTIDPVADIRGFEVHFRDKEKRMITGMTFSVGIELLNERTVGEGGAWSADRIRFDHPSEYLVGVEEYRSRNLVVSLSFITTKQKYGPYGTFDGPTTSSRSNPGRVVGFDWRRGRHCFLRGIQRAVFGFQGDALRVHVIPGNIVGCLRKCRGEVDPLTMTKLGKKNRVKNSAQFFYPPFCASAHSGQNQFFAIFHFIFCNLGACNISLERYLQDLSNDILNSPRLQKMKWKIAKN